MDGVFTSRLSMQLVAFYLSYFMLTKVLCTACPCVDPNLCKPIPTSVTREVFAFSVDPNNWRMYDWNRLTTLALVKYYNAELLCFAHSKQVKVVYLADFPLKNLTNVADRHRWVVKQIDYIRTHFLDGVNVDFEEPISESAVELRDGLTALMTELAIQLTLFSADAQVTFDTVYDPIDTDRHFDYFRISQLTDFIFVMAYDECVPGIPNAWANSAYNTTYSGLKLFMKQGIPPEKMILGLPWYGYEYPCKHFDKKDDSCELVKANWCGDAGTQHSYDQLIALLPNATRGRRWDPVAKSPYFSYLSNRNGVWYQVWYDDAESLDAKYELVTYLKLGGVGMWHADCLDYSDTERGRKMRELMWGTLPLRV